MGEQRALTSAMERGGVVLEQRDPMGATQPLDPYTALNKTMVPKWDGDDAITLAYYANVYVYRAVFVCAAAIAGLPFRSGGDPEKPDVFNPKSPLAVMLSPPPGGPAPNISARKLWAWTVVQYLVTGKWAWEIEGTEKKGKGKVAHLWPLVSCALQAVPSEGGNNYFTGFEYGKPGANRDTIKKFTLDQVLYAWRPAADDFRQPESPLQAARLPVSVAVMQDRYDYAFLRNDARPAAVVVHEQFARESEREAFKRAFRAEFRGPNNAGKTMFVEASGDTGTGTGGVAGALDIKVLGLNHRDAEFIQRYSQKISDICVALGTPLSILGDSTKRTYDSANVEHRNWWESTLQPLCADLADDVNLQLVPRLNQSEVGWFDFSKVKALQSDSRVLALGAVLPLMVGPGKPISTAEFRNELGLVGERPDDPQEAKLAAAAPAEGPDMTTGADGRPLGTPVGAKPTAGNAPSPTPGHVSPPSGKSALGRELETRASTRTREVRTAEWRAADATVAGLEPVFSDVMRHVFEKQATSVLARLGGRRGKRANTGASITAADVFDKEFWNQETAASIRSAYGAAYAAASNAVDGALGVKIAAADSTKFVIGVKNPEAQKFITRRANQLAGQVNDTTYEAIQGAIVEGTVAGESIPLIADRIQAVFADASDTRAEMIARTEVNSAYNGATELLGQALPDTIANGKEWLATIDERTREDHLSADGQQVSLDDVFTVGDSDLKYPGDPEGDAGETINCRCKLVLLTPDDWNGPDWISDQRDAPIEVEDVRELAWAD